MTSLLRILQVSGGRVPIPPNGAFSPENVIHSFSTALVELGHEVTLIDSPGLRSPVPYRVFEVPSGPQGNVNTLKATLRGLWFGFNAAKKVRELLHHETFDIVIFHFQFPALMSLLAGKAREIPTLYFLHSPVWSTIEDYRRLLNKVVFWPERTAMRRVDCIICGTSVVANNIKLETCVPQSKLRVVAYGLADDWFTEPSSAYPINDTLRSWPPVIMNVGIIHPRKNQEMLLRATPAIVQQIPKARVEFAGPIIDTAYMKRLAQIAHDLGVREHVSFLGEVPRTELRERYLRASVFVSTSTAEVSPIALVEAMASGVPVVATCIEVIKENIPTGCGVLVPPNDPGALAGAVVQILQDPQHRASLMNAAWQYAYEHRRWSSVADSISHIVTELGRNPSVRLT